MSYMAALRQSNLSGAQPLRLFLLMISLYEIGARCILNPSNPWPFNKTTSTTFSLFAVPQCNNKSCLLDSPKVGFKQLMASRNIALTENNRIRQRIPDSGKAAARKMVLRDLVEAQTSRTLGPFSVDLLVSQWPGTVILKMSHVWPDIRLGL